MAKSIALHEDCHVLAARLELWTTAVRACGVRRRIHRSHIKLWSVGGVQRASCVSIWDTNVHFWRSALL